MAARRGSARIRRSARNGRAARAVGLSAAALASLTLAACGGGTSAADTVEKSIAATEKVQTFHFTLDIRNQPRSTSGLQLTAAEGDIVVPDRMRADVAGTFAGTAITTQLVVVGEETFYKDPLSGSWQRIDVGTSPIPFFDPAEGVLAVMRAATGLERDGSETVGGTDAVRLTAEVAVKEVSPLLGNPPSDELVAATFWIGKDDSILRRVRVSGPINPGEPADVERVVEVSRFGEPVTIEPPKVSG